MVIIIINVFFFLSCVFLCVFIVITNVINMTLRHQERVPEKQQPMWGEGGV